MKKFMILIFAVATIAAVAQNGKIRKDNVDLPLTSESFTFNVNGDSSKVLTSRFEHDANGNQTLAVSTNLSGVQQDSILSTYSNNRLLTRKTFKTGTLALDETLEYKVTDTILVYTMKIPAVDSTIRITYKGVKDFDQDFLDIDINVNAGMMSFSMNIPLLYCDVMLMEVQDGLGAAWDTTVSASFTFSLYPDKPSSGSINMLELPMYSIFGVSFAYSTTSTHDEEKIFVRNDQMSTSPLAIFTYKYDLNTGKLLGTHQEINLTIIPILGLDLQDILTSTEYFRTANRLLGIVSRSFDTTYNDLIETASEWFAFQDVSIVEPGQVYTSLGVYPNPTTDYITINGLEGLTDVKIFDLNGKLIRQMQTSHAKISVNDLPSGLYFVTTSTDDKINIGRFVKE